MSTTGSSADRTTTATGVSASGVEVTVGVAAGGAQSADGAAAVVVLGAILGATPSTEGQPVVLFVDGQGDPLEIDPDGEVLLVQAGLTWAGRSASEVV
jgi:hypothetical protein